jgi:hypothetical protein
VSTIEKPNLIISFSGGETSAFMTAYLLYVARHNYGKVYVIFANTGEEREETLEFVRDCDVNFGFNTIWIESVVNPEPRKGPGFRVVNFDTASRNGEPFEAFIKKYGIPNMKFKGCTRVLKRQPIEAFARAIGLRPKSYKMAIGIRADEIDRMRTDNSIDFIYPLIQDIPVTKININTWWARAPFRLKLKGYEGNCKWCWKKSFRKHYTLLSEHPEFYNFPERMENLYGRVGPEFSKPTVPDNYSRKFFRGNVSTAELRQLAKTKEFTPAQDDHVIFDEELDVGAGCEETCEVFGDD